MYSISNIRQTVSTLLVAFATLPCFSQEVVEQQSIEIVQDGHAVPGSQAPGNVQEFAMRRGAFELRVGKRAGPGANVNLGDTPFEVCASTDPAIFKGIEIGMRVGAMPCLNGAAVMARSPEETKQSVELMLSKGDGNNSFEESTVTLTPSASIVKISKITDFVVTGQTCLGPSQRRRCIDQRQPVAFQGQELYLLVFTDLNGDHVADDGEFSRIKLRF